jgi:hypothetical protein
MATGRMWGACRFDWNFMSGFDFSTQRVRFSGPALLFAGTGIVLAILVLGAMLGQASGAHAGLFMNSLLIPTTAPMTS